ncbi:MAG TPA: rRNA adenine N-6-methyltransferase family protein [Micropepsaceae bacterium]|nr:rRNA adenine N-6-methyltransferase family protein [Micropepsaceae bacterium]
MTIASAGISLVGFRHISSPLCWLLTMDQNNPGRLLFFKRWVANPFRLGSIVPSGKALARAVAQNIQCEPGEYVIEYGGGTGTITSELVKKVPPEKLIVFELDPDLARHLKKAYPQVTVIQGDVSKVKDLLPPGVAGNVGCIVCGIPMLLLPDAVQLAITEGMFSVLKPGRFFLQFTYSWFSPLPRERLGLTGKRVAFATANVPPASLWRYERLKS